MNVLTRQPDQIQSRHAINLAYVINLCGTVTYDISLTV